MKKKLIILSGPSCVGKTPLLKAMACIHPGIRYGRSVLYNSRPPRPVETEGVDYHFRKEEEIRKLPEDRFLVGRARAMLQAVDLDEVQQILTGETLVILEIYPTLGRLFMDHPRVKQLAEEFETRTVFLSPLTFDEIADLQKRGSFTSPEDAVASVMLPKLLGRSLQQGKLLGTAELEDLTTRASKAYDEILMSKGYTDVIVNHDGEESNNWKLIPPIGDAGNALRKFVKIIRE